MLPTLTPAHDEQYPVARASYPSYPPHHAQHPHHHPAYAYQGGGGHVISGLPQPPPPPPPVPEYSSAGGGMIPNNRHQPPPSYSPSEWPRYGRPATHGYGSPPERGHPPGSSPEGQGGRGEPDRR